MDIDFNKYPLPRRFRHHTAPNLYLPFSDLKVVPNYYPPVYKLLNWNDVFINGIAPNNLDIGCGKGGFLLEYAESNPESNILGIELRHTPVEWIENYIKSEKIENVSAIWYSVVNGLGFIENNSIDNIFYLFPDPWHKRKHHKRRAFNNEVIIELDRVLNNHGKLYLATDVLEVHEHHIDVLNEFGKFKFVIIENDSEWKLPITNKERFCRAKDIPFYRIICEK